MNRYQVVRLYFDNNTAYDLRIDMFLEMFEESYEDFGGVLSCGSKAYQNKCRRWANTVNKHMPE